MASILNGFQETLVKAVAESTGLNVSKQKAWDMYKAMINASVDFTLVQPKVCEAGETGTAKTRIVSLAGVGKWAVTERKPVPNPDKPSPKDKWDVIPNIKFYPSSKLRAMVETAYGHAPVKEETETEAE